MLKSTYKENETELVKFPTVASRKLCFNGYEQIVLFHNVTSGVCIYSTKEEEIGKYSDNFNFLNFNEFKGSITISN